MKLKNRKIILLPSGEEATVGYLGKDSFILKDYVCYRVFEFKKKDLGKTWDFKKKKED